jgi:hypothetical protein
MDEVLFVLGESPHGPEQMAAKKMLPIPAKAFADRGEDVSYDNNICVGR